MDVYIDLFIYLANILYTIYIYIYSNYRLGSWGGYTLK